MCTGGFKNNLHQHFFAKNIFSILGCSPFKNFPTHCAFFQNCSILLILEHCGKQVNMLVKDMRMMNVWTKWAEPTKLYQVSFLAPHVKISHFLPHKIFQRCGIGHLISIHTWILEVWSLLLWKFGLGSYSRFKIHWCLALRFTVNTTLTVKILALTNSARFVVLIHWTANCSAKHQWILDLE